MQSSEKFVSISFVQDNERSSGLQRIPVRLIPLFQESYDFGSKAVYRDGSRHFNASARGQAHIDEGKICMETLSSAEYFLTTRSFCNNFYLLLALQQTTQAFAAQGMLAHEQDTEPMA